MGSYANTAFQMTDFSINKGRQTTVTNSPQVSVTHRRKGLFLTLVIVQGGLAKDLGSHSHLGAPGSFLLMYQPLCGQEAALASSSQ